MVCLCRHSFGTIGHSIVLLILLLSTEIIFCNEIIEEKEDDNLIVSYVIESFEEHHNDWNHNNNNYDDDDDDDDGVGDYYYDDEELLTYQKKKLNKDFQFGGGRGGNWNVLEMRRADKALFGRNSLYFSFEKNQNNHGQQQDEVETTSSVYVESILSERGRSHNCYGASYLSFWYQLHKFAAVADDDDGGDDWAIQMTLLDDADCDDAIRNCSESVNLEAWSFKTDPLPNGIKNEWTELRIPTNSGKWQKQPNEHGLLEAGNGSLDLNRIKGWRIEVIFPPSSQSSIKGSMHLDQLSFQGGGELLGAPFFGANTFQELVDSQTLLPLSNSAQTRNRSKQIITENGTFIIQYSVEREVWGGFLLYMHIPPARAYYNLSNANAVSFDYRVLQAPSVKRRAQFRLRFMDSSDCSTDCAVYPGFNLEEYTSFHFILDEPDGGGTVSVELKGDDQITSPFWCTGYFGQKGNGVLDREIIKGFKISIGIDSQGDVGSVVSGGLEFSNFRASSASDFTPDLHHDQSKCTTEPHLRFLTTTGSTNFKRIEFTDISRCCDICQEDPDCLYAMHFRRDCYTTAYVDPEIIQYNVDADFVGMPTFAFWKDTEASRGHFCQRCKCNTETNVIDCRGRDLVLVPKVFSFSEQQPPWSPQVLDLRDNPRLTMLGSGVFEQVPSLEELRLPINATFISPKSISDLPLLKTVIFEVDEDLEHSEPRLSPKQHQLSNVITDSTDAFGHVCCGLGEHVPLSVTPTEGLTFCNLEVDKPGVDAVYEPFVQYVNADTLAELRPSTPFMSEAAESAEKCAEYCDIQPDCRYFSYDGRSKLVQHVCHLLRDQGTPTRVCCLPEHYEDSETMTKPGWVSGRVARTRCEVDGARVFVGTTRAFPATRTLVVEDANNYTTQFFVSLGSMPLRGAVWVEPRVTSSTSDADLTFSPSRAVFYDNETVAIINVTVSNAKKMSKAGLVVVTSFVEACDTAFLNSHAKRTDDLALVIDVILPTVSSPPDHRLLEIGLIISGAIGTLLGITLFLCTERKRRLAQAGGIWLIQASELKFGDPPKVLGRGTFGLVLLAEYRGTQVAVKRILPPQQRHRRRLTLESGRIGQVRDETRSAAIHDLEQASQLSQDVESGLMSINNSAPRLFFCHKNEYRRQKANFIADMRHLSKLRHPCITTIMGAVISRTEEPMLVMEYMDHGSLYDLLHNETMVLEGEHILPILRDIAQGVRFLHASNPQVVHGDLKSLNILVDGRFRAKVADYGLLQKKKLDINGTSHWMAPELLHGGKNNSTPESDVYSFGVILCEIYSRQDPYEEETEGTRSDTSNAIMILDATLSSERWHRHTVPSTCPSEIKALASACLCEDPGKRPTFEDLDLEFKDLSISNVEPAETETITTITSSPSSISRRSLTMHRTQTERLLDEIFPPHVAEALRDGRRVEPETHEMVTIFFSDIVGFTEISAKLSPMKVADMLDRLYLKFDSLSQKHDIFKVETVGDCWMGVANLVKKQTDHTKRIADFAVDVLAAANDTWIDLDDKSLGFTNMRIGFHSGPVVANVVGSRNPRYCLFGDTVNTASRMESNSERGRIQCTAASAKLLQEQDPSRGVRCRGMIHVKGKSLMQTFWVNEMGLPSLPSSSYLEDAFSLNGSTRSRVRRISSAW